MSPLGAGPRLLDPQALFQAACAAFCRVALHKAQLGEWHL